MYMYVYRRKRCISKEKMYMYVSVRLKHEGPHHMYMYVYRRKRPLPTQGKDVYRRKRPKEKMYMYVYRRKRPLPTSVSSVRLKHEGPTKVPTSRRASICMYMYVYVCICMYVCMLAWACGPSRPCDVASLLRAKDDSIRST